MLFFLSVSSVREKYREGVDKKAARVACCCISFTMASIVSAEYQY